MNNTYNNPLRPSLFNQRRLDAIQVKKQRNYAEDWSDSDSDSDSYEDRTVPIQPSPSKPTIGSTTVLIEEDTKKKPLKTVGNQYLSKDGSMMNIVLGDPLMPKSRHLNKVSKRLLVPLARKEHSQCISNREVDISQKLLERSENIKYTVPKSNVRKDYLYVSDGVWPLPEPIKWTKSYPKKLKPVTVAQRKSKAQEDVNKYKYHSYFGSTQFKEKLAKMRDYYADDFEEYFDK